MRLLTPAEVFQAATELLARYPKSVHGVQHDLATQA
jgi:hypothetical protein